MKGVLTILICFFCFACKAQICVQVNCPRTISYPQDTIKIAGLITSTDATTTTWKVIIGSATIDNPSSISTVARNLSKGGSLFVFALTATSVNGSVGTAFDTVIYVGNQPPIASCGQSYTDTTTAGVLTGSGTDPEGMPVTYLWQQINGPNQAVITSPTFQNPLITGLITGIYIFQLKVTDNGGLSSTATQTVYVTLPTTLIKTVTTISKYYSDGSVITTTTTVP